jgi:signal transduction histidine kinase
MLRLHFILTLLLLALIPPAALVSAQTGSERRMLATGPDRGTADTALLQRFIDSSAALTNRDTALMLLERAHRTSLEAAYPLGVATALLHAGEVSVWQGKYEAAREKFRQCIPMLQQIPGGRAYLATAYYQVGICYQRMGESERSTPFYYQALKAVAAIPESRLPVERVYNRLAEVFSADPKLARRYEAAEEAIIRRKQDWPALGIFLLNRAKEFNKRGQFAEGDSCVTLALEIGKAQHDSLLRYRAYMVLASARLHAHKPAEALHYLGQTETLGVREKDMFQENANLFLWSEAHYQLGNYREAERYAQIILEKSRQQGLREQEAHAHDMLAVAYAGMGQYKRAFEHHQWFKYLKDQILNERIAANAQLLEQRYQEERKDRIIAESNLLIAGQQRDLAGKNLLLSLAGVVILLLTGITLFIYRNYRERQRHALQQQQIGLLKGMIDGAEQERRRVAIDLHDGIGGMLAALKMKIGALRRRLADERYIGDLEDLDRMVIETGTEVRRTAHNLIPDILELHDLQYALVRFCNDIRHRGQVEVDLSLNGELQHLDKQTELTVYRLVQELVQNVLKHAEASQVSVQVILFDDQLSITVEDNGKGFDPSAQPEGLGLRQIRNRVQLLGGTVEISSVPQQSTLVNILFPAEVH